MAIVDVEGEELVVRLGSWEKVGAVRGDLRIPVASAQAARLVDNARKEVRGMRAPGTGWPGSILLGTFRSKGWKDFAATYRDDPGFVLDLEGQPFRRLIVSADLPDELAHLVDASGG